MPDHLRAYPVPSISSSSSQELLSILATADVGSKKAENPRREATVTQRQDRRDLLGQRKTLQLPTSNSSGRVLYGTGRLVIGRRVDAPPGFLSNARPVFSASIRERKHQTSSGSIRVTFPANCQEGKVTLLPPNNPPASPAPPCPLAFSEFSPPNEAKAIPLRLFRPDRKDMRVIPTLLPAAA